MTVTPARPLLGDLCGGAVRRPGRPGYDEARTPWNLAADLRPAAVAHPGRAEELAAAVRAARDAGLRIAVQGTGTRPARSAIFPTCCSSARPP